MSIGTCSWLNYFHVHAVFFKYWLNKWLSLPLLGNFLSPCIRSIVPGSSNRSLPVYLAGVGADPEPAAEAPVRGRRVRGAVRGSLPVY